jgi:PTH1 family peptidyl-tRNA hydrolase
VFRRKPKPVPTCAVVGLGNPGPEYRGTRHNVGFEAVDRLAERHKIKLGTLQHHARWGVGEAAGRTVLLAKPTTYMNLSGRAVAALLRAYGLGPDGLLVLADEMDLPVGRILMRPKGGAGGHNGHRSILQALGTDEYARIKIGIGKPAGQGADHVLNPFHPDERAEVDRAIDTACDVVEAWLDSGLDRAMQLANTR